MTAEIEKALLSIPALVQRLNAFTEERAMDSLIFTTTEAMRFAKVGSDSALYRWAEKWSVKPVSHGRWSRAQMELAIEREAGLARTPATLKRKQAALKITSGAHPLKANDPVPVGRETSRQPISA